MRRWAVLIAAGLALSGCKSGERDRPARPGRDHPPADPASRTRNPKGWLDGPTPGLDKVDTPPADSWADPRDPLYDVDREVRGVLAGFVEDPEGRKVRDVFIEVEPADGAAGGAPVGVQTDRQGYFLIKGLQPRQAYQLTARVALEGRQMAGRVYARTGGDRSQFVRIALLEGLTLPGGPAGRDLPAATGPAPGEVPPPVLPADAPAPRPEEPPPKPAADGAWSPTAPGRAPVQPPTTGGPARPPARPDLVADDPTGIWKPPAASIPNAAPPPKKSESRSVPPGNAFALIDTLGVQRSFPSGRAGELVLLEFMTSRCVQCRKAAPEVKGLQARYGARGLEVVGVLCDEADLQQRRAIAASFQRAEGLNYLLYVEPGADPGAVMRRFGVQAFPTLVLLDGSGAVAWQGKPRDVAELEKAIADELGRSQR